MLRCLTNRHIIIIIIILAAKFISNPHDHKHHNKHTQQFKQQFACNLVLVSGSTIPVSVTTSRYHLLTRPAQCQVFANGV